LPDTGSHSKDVGWYILGGIVSAFVTWFIATHLFPNPPPSGPPPSPPPLPKLPAHQVPLTQIQLPGNQSPPPSQGASKAAPKSGDRVQALRPTCNLPPVGETRFLPTEVILDVPATASELTLEAIASRHTMTRMETTTFRLTGRRLHRWRIDGGGSVQDMIRNICTERLVAGVQPNYLYALAQEQAAPLNSDQYAPQKLNLSEAHRLAKGNRVLVAVIDSEVDASHPDLTGAVTASFDASTDDERPHLHGTGMAGAIAARRNMLGTAPSVGLLTVRAFSARANSVEGTTFNILKGLDWAAAQGARVVNMSFAGPADPRLRDALEKAYKKGIVLIAAAGNAGPKSPPLFPGADKNVIAVTATDTNDALFTGANRGDYVAVAAPGVDILAPAPGGTYQLTTGTSVASAEVSGVVALLIERNPSITPADVRRILMSTAKDLGPKGKDRDFGAGLVNALQAVTAATPR
jgi:subtilisin family serine protease